MALYEKVKQLCKSKGIEISNLGIALDIPLTKGTVSKWQNGAKPRASTIKAIADYFGVSVDYLLADDSSEKNDDISKQKKELLDRIAGMTDEQAREVQEIVDYILEKKKRE